MGKCERGVGAGGTVQGELGVILLCCVRLCVILSTVCDTVYEVCEGSLG